MLNATSTSLPATRHLCLVFIHNPTAFIHGLFSLFTTRSTRSSDAPLINDIDGSDEREDKAQMNDIGAQMSNTRAQMDNILGSDELATLLVERPPPPPSDSLSPTRPPWTSRSSPTSAKLQSSATAWLGARSEHAAGSVLSALGLITQQVHARSGHPAALGAVPSADVLASRTDAPLAPRAGLKQTRYSAYRGQLLTATGPSDVVAGLRNVAVGFAERIARGVDVGKAQLRRVDSALDGHRKP
ncbi:uncharacterized protein SCHCODRAFT_01155662 [Schizophyllum commune H4-8]|nr:uncharacterized protein SCHCODRAFT_01155662 [Schizophyllum commune H4-8]KAI5890241.1 hypothetical protein SCHCODRAFT_01155662 [Schizophyllum commune H4-8]